MNIYDNLISQAKDNLYESVKNQQKTSASSFDNVLDTLQGMLNTAQSMSDKFKNFDNSENKQAQEQLDAAVKEAKESLEKLNSTQDDLAAALKAVEKQAKEDEEMFKTFDFMQLMTQLMYGTNDESEKNKIYKKMQDLANSVK